jgi:hypothetical protein
MRAYIKIDREPMQLRRDFETLPRIGEHIVATISARVASRFVVTDVVHVLDANRVKIVVHVAREFESGVPR